MKVIVCGGRDFSNVAFIWSHLDRLHAEHPFTAIMHGGAAGADSIAAEWALTKARIVRYVCLANWKEHGRSAGPKRNARMMEWEPDLVVSFPGGRGTADMVRRAKAAGVRVHEITTSTSSTSRACE